MSYITGIGGFFFRSQNPESLKKWYTEILGIEVYEHLWHQAAGPTVFEPFASDTDYFPKEKQWMLNLRVTDLPALIKDLDSKGVKVEQKAEWNSSPEIGTFARVYDPEGNPIELWQPAKK